ncbi:MAG TPA: hypothetical protein VHZ73_10010 [Vicinamibacterales bacterium]|nr:hypothetical protein [Vicinamibacterales bacterium]
MKQVLAALLLVSAAAVYPRAQAPAPAADIVGTWDVTTSSPISETTNPMEVTQDGDTFKAVVKGDGGQLPYDKVTLKGSDVTLVLTIDFQGSPMTITYSGVVDGKKMSGDADFGGLATGTWSAIKK